MSVDGLNLSVKSISIHRIIPQYWWSRISYAILTGHIEKSLYLFLLYNCGTVAVAPRSVAETETLYLAYTLDFFALLQKLQINIIHLLLVTKYTFMWVENGMSISHVLLSFS